MDVWSITVAALRRWYILLPLLALTGGAAYLVGQGVKPEYEVEAAAIVIPGPDSADYGNPYGSVADANSILGIVLNGPETRARVAAEGLVSSYTVSPASRSAVMSFGVRGDTPEEAVATGELVFQIASEGLAERQTAAGMPESAQYRIEVLQAPAVTAVVHDGKTRNMAVVGVLGAALSLLLAVLFDDIVGLIKKWRAGRRLRAAESKDITEGSRDETEGESAGTEEDASPDEDDPAPPGVDDLFGDASAEPATAVADAGTSK
ncbi:hypothetical protein [Occultella kanbiaonis]|uniref:hypothetical protein n=1 Tax=Occultella kanbiaonis TaxID=2675754 RepID=UPI0012B7F06F|nr:hypothetical protein [Occultella kanbiaonis]